MCFVKFVAWDCIMFGFTTSRMIPQRSRCPYVCLSQTTVGCHCVDQLVLHNEGPRISHAEGAGGSLQRQESHVAPYRLHDDSRNSVHSTVESRLVGG
jgi:hypothetical protein